MLYRLASWLGFALAFLFIAAVAVRADTALLNVSYDVARELYKDINPAFTAACAADGSGVVTVNQSHGGSSKQVMSVVGGLEADVVTMNQPTDIDYLAQHDGLVAKDWRARFPFDAAPYTTTTVFLVRKGNPKGIRDWDDLAKPGREIIVPNPKTSGNGRYAYLAAWGYALDKTGTDDDTREFVKRFFANVPVLDGGGRGATTTFTQRGIGDALVTFENEAILIGQELGGEQFEIVYPSLTIEAPAPVAVIEPVVDRRGTRKAAEAYLRFLFSPDGQAIIARHHFRPRDAAVLKDNGDRFPAVRTFTVEQRLGGWAEAQAKHFAEGGVYDQIQQSR